MKYILISIFTLILLLINCEKKLNMPSTPSGPDTGIINYNYYFSSSASDISGDSIAIRFDWGDGDTSYWSEFVASGDMVTMSHTWTTARTYSVRAQACNKSMQLSDWSFSKEFVVSSNRPPDAPQIPSGPFSGSVNIFYTFSTTTFDADADSIAYQFDWGDGIFSEWSNFFPTGVITSMQYAWSDTGFYLIRARAKDKQGAVSSWSYVRQMNISLTGSLFPNYVIANIPVGIDPISVTVLPNGNYIYVANQASSDISVIQTSTNSVIATIPVGLNPTCVAASVNSDYVYVANSGTDNVAVIRTSDNTVINTITVGALPSGIAVLPNGQYLYVTNLGSDDISVIQTSNHAVIATITNVNQPNGITALPDNQFVYATSPYQNNIAVIRTNNNTIHANVTVTNQPTHLTSSLSGEYIYVTNFSSNTVLTIRTSNNEITASIPVANNPLGIATYPYDNYLYVTNQTSNTVSVINGSNNKVVASIPVQTSPAGLATHPDGNYIYVTNSGSNTVSVIKKF